MGGKQCPPEALSVPQKHKVNDMTRTIFALISGYIRKAILFELCVCDTEVQKFVSQNMRSFVQKGKIAIK